MGQDESASTPVPAATPTNEDLSAAPAAGHTDVTATSDNSNSNPSHVSMDDVDAAGSSLLPPSRRRVKVYQLSTGGEWTDRGTGYITYNNTQHTTNGWENGHTKPVDSNEPRFSLIVTADVDVDSDGAAASAAAAAAGVSTAATPAETPVILLNHPIVYGVDYQRQSDTIITWCMAQSGVDVALSFQEAAVCMETWQIISQQMQIMQATAMAHAKEQDAMQDAISFKDGVTPFEDRIGVLGSVSVGGLSGGAHPDVGVAMDLDDELDLPEDVAALLAQREVLTKRLANLRHIADDYPHMPPVTIDAIDRITHRFTIYGISRRELREVIQIWKAKEEEFEMILNEERQEMDQARSKLHAAAASSAAESSSTAAASPSSVTPAAAPAPALSSYLSPSSSSATHDLNGSMSSSLMVTLGHLHSIFRLVKSLLITSHAEILEVLFDEELDALIAMLEYDPIYSDHPLHGPSPPHDFHTHRSWLKNAKFKYVIPFHDEMVLHKIHQTYKVSYLKDVILANHLDDAGLQALTQIIFVNTVSILSRLTEKREFIEGLFHTLNQFAKIDKKDVEEEKERRALFERQQTVLLNEELDDSQSSALNGSAGSIQSEHTQQAEAGSQASITPQSPNHASAASAHSDGPHASIQDSSQQTDAAATTAGTSSSSPAPPHASLQTVLLFLQELVLMAKNVRVSDRDAFYKMLDQNALFDVIESILLKGEESLKDPTGANAILTVPDTPSWSNSLNSGGESPRHWLWLICTDIISNICIHDATLFRTYLIASFDSPNSILNMIFRLMSAAHLSISVAHQLSCLIRLVLDPEGMSVQDQHLFLARIYEDHLWKLLDPLNALQPNQPDQNPFDQPFSETTNPVALREEARKRRHREASADAYQVAAYHAIELLSYCALHHNASADHRSDDDDSITPTDYFRRLALKHRVLPIVLNVLRTTRRNDLVCSAIRFFRICIGARDLFYTRIIIDGNLFEPIFMHFKENGSRYNLLNSVVCEMMLFFNETHRALEKGQEKIFNPNSIVFINYICVKFWKRYELDKIQYVNTFQESKQIWLDFARIIKDGSMVFDDNLLALIVVDDDDGGVEDGASPAESVDRIGQVNPKTPPARPNTNHTAITISKTTHSILSDSDDEEQEQHDDARQTVPSHNSPIGTIRQNKFSSPSIGDLTHTATTPINHDKITHRKKVRTPTRDAHEYKSSLLSSEYYLDDDASSGDSSSLVSPVAVAAVDPTGHTDADHDEFEEVIPAGHIHPPLSSVPPAPDVDVASRRRIMFVAGDAEPPVTSSPRKQTPKRKLADSTPEALSIATTSPTSSTTLSPDSRGGNTHPHNGVTAPNNGAFLQLSHSTHSSPVSSPHVSPSLKAHTNPYLHVAASELPPTAIRSPELKSIATMPLAPNNSGPHSPPRQITTLDLAEDADAASEGRHNATMVCTAPHAHLSSPSAASDAIAKKVQLQSAPVSPTHNEMTPVQTAKRRRTDSSL